MTRKTLLPLIAVAAATVVPTTAALAASSGSTVPATADSVKIQSGYAYYDSFKPANKRLIVVVIKTKGQLPRRFDGLIRAGGTFAKHRGGSMGSVGGRASRCYTFTVPLKNGRFYPTDSGSGTGPKASPGRYTVTVSAKDADGKTVTSGKTITLRDRKPGDRSGKPIGC
ncbi:MAG: hypothetical protein ABUM26_06275 [Solirubrobacterales bacterium]